MEIARFEKRIFAYLIDLIIPAAIGLGLGVLLILYVTMPWYFKLVIIIVMSYAFYLLINVPFFILSKGRSIGSFIFGIKTVTEDGDNISKRMAWVKCLYLGLVPFVIVNAIYMIIIHSEKTAFDSLSGCITINNR